MNHEAPQNGCMNPKTCPYKVYAGSTFNEIKGSNLPITTICINIYSNDVSLSRDLICSLRPNQYALITDLHRKLTQSSPLCCQKVQAVSILDKRPFGVTI